MSVVMGQEPYKDLSLTKSCADLRGEKKAVKNKFYIPVASTLAFILKIEFLQF